MDLWHLEANTALPGLPHPAFAIPAFPDSRNGGFIPFLRPNILQASLSPFLLTSFISSSTFKNQLDSYHFSAPWAKQQPPPLSCCNSFLTDLPALPHPTAKWVHYTQVRSGHFSSQ